MYCRKQERETYVIVLLEAGARNYCKCIVGSSCKKLLQMYFRTQEQKTDVNVLPTSPTKSTATSTATPTAIFAATSAATYAAICAAVLFVCLFDPDAVHSN